MSKQRCEGEGVRSAQDAGTVDAARSVPSGGGGMTRLSFVKASAAAAAGVGAVGAPAATALSSESATTPVRPSAAPETDTVMAYVRDARRGEVTVVAGSGELTYRDPALVKRLLAAAPKISTTGGLDVVTP
jgi:hypothetical protein